VRRDSLASYKPDFSPELDDVVRIARAEEEEQSPEPPSGGC
jgi:hypothetical protein